MQRINTWLRTHDEDSLQLRSRGDGQPADGSLPPGGCGSRQGGSDGIPSSKSLHKQAMRGLI